MSPIRPAAAVDPRIFGRGIRRDPEPERLAVPSNLGSDLRLFATTFVAGFIFVSVYLA
jgi:hypothetical protein